MTLHREHVLELLTLLAVIAVIQFPNPAQVDASDAAPVGVHAVKSAPVSVGSEDATHRVDPIALLQASVPEDWRVQLPPFEQPERTTLTC